MSLTPPEFPIKKSFRKRKDFFIGKAENYPFFLGASLFCL